MDKLKEFNKLKVKELFFNTINNLNKSIVPVLIFQVIFNLAMFTIINPFLKLLIKFFLPSSYNGILFNEKLPEFIFSISGLIFILVISFVAVLLVFFEFAVMLIMIQKGIKDEKIGLKDSIKEGFLKLKLIMNPSYMNIAIYILILIPVIGIGLNSSLVPQIIIPNFILDEVLKYNGGNILIGFFLIFLISLFIRLLFVLPIIIFEDMEFKQAVKKSKSITVGYTFRISIYLFLLITFWMLIGILPVALLSRFKGIVFDILIIGFVFLYTFITMSITPFVLTFITTMYNYITRPEYKLKNINLKDIKESVNFIKIDFKRRLKELFKELRSNPKISIVVIILLGINLIGIGSEDMEYIYPEQPLIIGHRGSLKGVENTVEAVLAAAEGGAEYAEIDILLSKDNIPMVIHDNNLSRLSGKNKTISNLNSSEIEDITIKSENYKGNIDSLDIFYDGIVEKIDLLIELKTHGKETKSVVEETVKVLKEKDLGEPIFHTTDYNLLLEMKENYPDYKIGYIIIGKLGWLTSDVVEAIPADFLVFEESLVRQSLVNTVHRANKAVFVWTVNKEKAASELMDLKVDGIITDYPDKMVKLRDKK